MAKISYLHQHPDIAQGLEKLLRDDKIFSKLGFKPEEMLWKKRTANFQAFMSTIISQQISIKAAASIFKKLHDRMDGNIHPAGFMELTDLDLREVGLSNGKIKYGRGLADAILSGAFSPARLRHMDDEAVINEIVKLQGFGVWSAQMFLIFGLARPDVWPVGDLGIQIGAQYYLRLEEKADLATLTKLGQKWKGNRTAASLILWHMSNNKIRI